MSRYKQARGGMQDVCICKCHAFPEGQWVCTCRCWTKLADVGLSSKGPLDGIGVSQSNKVDDYVSVEKP